MPILHSLHRLLARQLRRPRSRGYGVQSPWAYRFLREVIMAKEGRDRALPFTERLERRCGKVTVVSPATAAEELDAILGTARPPEVLLLRDIHRSRAAHRLWQQLISDARTGVAFDCFDFGLLFFDRKLYKRRYKVNYAE